MRCPFSISVLIAPGNCGASPMQATGQSNERTVQTQVCLPVSPRARVERRAIMRLGCAFPPYGQRRQRFAEWPAFGEQLCYRAVVQPHQARSPAARKQPSAPAKAASHRTPGDIMSERRATSSRNARATSSESAHFRQAPSQLAQ
jgi:hypothetical protein